MTAVSSWTAGKLNGQSAIKVPRHTLLWRSWWLLSCIRPLHRLPNFSFMDVYLNKLTAVWMATTIILKSSGQDHGQVFYRDNSFLTALDIVRLFSGQQQCWILSFSASVGYCALLKLFRRQQRRWIVFLLPLSHLQACLLSFPMLACCVSRLSGSDKLDPGPRKVLIV